MSSTGGRVLALLSALLFIGCAGMEGGDDIGSSEAELFGAGSCRQDAYPEHGVYDTTLIYMIDETVPAGVDVFLPMDADRNTLEYRTGAYNFFRERYGIDFDPNVEGEQIASDGGSGLALVQPIKTGEGSTHQIYGLDAQRFPQWRHRMPMTNTAFLDDGYFVFILSDFDATGTYNGRIRAGDLVVQGEYRMFDDRARLLDVITYFADTPATVNPFNGDEAASAGATFVNITCRVESPLFGVGVTRGIGEQRPNADGSLTLDFRYVMRFPSVLEEGTTTRRPRCRNIRPLWRW